MKKLRICYIADWKSIHIQRWLKYFVNKGHKVHLISDNPQRCKELEGIILHNLIVPGENKIKKISWRFYLTLRELKLKWLLKIIKPDILHSHFASYYGWWGAKSGFHPFVLTVMGSDIHIIPQESQIARAQVKYTLEQSDLITSCSESLKEATIKLGASANKVCVVNRGVDFSKFNPQINHSYVLEKLNLRDSLIVLSSRSFRPIYNIDTIIYAIPYIVEEVPKVKFILMKSYGDDGTEIKLRNLASQLRISEKIEFISFVEHDDMPKYYNLADIFISVSSSDGGPPSLLEAMACGVAPIVSDLPSIREWIKDGENGYIVPVRDHEALANAIIRLLKNEQTRKLFAQRNLVLVQEKADYCKHMQRMEGLYFSLIKNYKKKRH